MYNSALVLNEILIVFTTNKPFQNDDEEVNYESKEQRYNVDFFINNFNNLLNILKKNDDGSKIEVTYGGEIKPFGFGKIKILELIGNLLKTKS